ncbi:MAG: ligase-associated DNA damage response endonuclease PdeM [Elainellaceae cyanobacterium]
MHEIFVLKQRLQLLPEKAVYVPDYDLLLVADVHLGKSEAFQSLGVPIPNHVNQDTLDRLRNLCDRLSPKTLIVLGDLFHSPRGLDDAILQSWVHFTETCGTTVQVILGNHDRAIATILSAYAIPFHTHPVEYPGLVLSHEPADVLDCVNLCGHIHPCLLLKTRLDTLRLPCFFLERHRLILPSFGSFTGGYEMRLKRGAIAYVVVEGAVVPFSGKMLSRQAF